jgi:hypothetical protein
MPSPKGPGKASEKPGSKGPSKPEPKGDRKPGDKSADLEKRLDRLMQELEAIRKEIRRPSK